MFLFLPFLFEGARQGSDTSGQRAKGLNIYFFLSSFVFLAQDCDELVLFLFRGREQSVSEVSGEV